MRQRILASLAKQVDAGKLRPVGRSRFLVYLMGPYRTDDIVAVLQELSAQVQATVPEVTTSVEAAANEEDTVFQLLLDTRECLRERTFNAFLAIDVGIDLDEMDAATQSIAFARASNAVVFVAPQIGDNLGVGIEIGSVLEEVQHDRQKRVSAVTRRSAHARRMMVATEAGVESTMLGAVNSRWDASVRSYTDAETLCALCARFCTHIQNEELYGVLDERS